MRFIYIAKLSYERYNLELFILNENDKRENSARQQLSNRETTPVDKKADRVKTNQ